MGRAATRNLDRASGSSSGVLRGNDQPCPDGIEFVDIAEIETERGRGRFLPRDRLEAPFETACLIARPAAGQLEGGCLAGPFDVEPRWRVFGDLGTHGFAGTFLTVSRWLARIAGACRKIRKAIGRR
jgi:hypothetical protein